VTVFLRIFILNRECFYNSDEELIKYGWPEDIWFHVDKLSSAHVYVRMPEGQTFDDMPKEVIEDCAQLVKANSIQGCKQSSVDVVYTSWSNLKKTADMVAGQIGFHSDKAVHKVKVERKINAILNRLNKTKVEKKDVNLMAEKEARDRRERTIRKTEDRERRLRLEEEKIKQQEMAKILSYQNVLRNENMTSNKECEGDLSDDFM
jgi:hypothetical protein